MFFKHGVMVMGLAMGQLCGAGEILAQVQDKGSDPVSLKSGRGLVCQPSDSRSQMPKIHIDLIQDGSPDQSHVQLASAQEFLHAPIEKTMGVDLTVVSAYLGNYDVGIGDQEGKGTEKIRLSVLPQLDIDPDYSSSQVLPGQAKKVDALSTAIIDYQREYGVRKGYNPLNIAPSFKRLKAELILGKGQIQEYSCQLIADPRDRVYVVGSESHQKTYRAIALSDLTSNPNEKGSPCQMGWVGRTSKLEKDCDCLKSLFTPKKKKIESRKKPASPDTAPPEDEHGEVFDGDALKMRYLQELSQFDPEILRAIEIIRADPETYELLRQAQKSGKLSPKVPDLDKLEELFELLGEPESLESKALMFPKKLLQIEDGKANLERYLRLRKQVNKLIL